MTPAPWQPPPSQPPFVVVGAGPSGLGAASELAQAGPVVVLDRIPVTGGIAGWDNHAVKELTRAVVERGADLQLGQTAVRYDGQALTVACPTGFRQVATRALVFAGGLRPATPADLGIDGHRVAGVLPATVAEHLLHTGVRLWDNVVILGTGPWARPIARLCQGSGARVIVIADQTDDPDSTDMADWADQRLDWPGHIRVIGASRVSGLELTPRDTAASEAAPTFVRCDAVLLAADPRPNRNVTGALVESDRNVFFHQPVHPDTPKARYAAAARATRAWLNANGGPS